MDIQSSFFNIINSENNNWRHSYAAIEKLVMVMLEDYILQQNKRFFVNYSKDNNSLYDGYAPDGFDDFIGSTAVELKVFRSTIVSPSLIYATIERLATHKENFNNLLIIIIGEISKLTIQNIQDEAQNPNFKLVLWNIDDLTRLFEKNAELFCDTYNNLNSIFVKEAISVGINRNISSHIEKRSKYITQLNREYDSDNIVLFLGAGVSRAAKVATWDELISELFVTLINKELDKNGIRINEADKEKIVYQVMKQNGNSPLLQTRFLRNGFAAEFEEIVRNILYKKAEDTSPLLEEIGQICIPHRGKIGIRAIVNYNFDDLVEKNLERLRVKCRSIYAEGAAISNYELGIFHVHGFLPQTKNKYENLSNSLLVFSEEGYHKLLLEPYNWANITQLNYLINNTCLFIGLSMTDPNMRRLLEIAAQKRADGDNGCRHYAFIKRFRIEKKDMLKGVRRFEIVNDSLQESLFKELGINILWIDDYDEIPILLKGIKLK